MRILFGGLCLLGVLGAPMAARAEPGTLVEVGAGVVGPNCLWLSQDGSPCGTRVLSQASGRVETHLFPVPNYSIDHITLGLGYQHLLAPVYGANQPDPLDGGLSPHSGRLLINTSAIHRLQGDQGPSLRGGLTVDLNAFVEGTREAADWFLCDGECDEFEGMGLILLPLAPIIGLVDGAGLELGCGY